METMRTVAMLAVVASVVLLSGCTTQIPAGPTKSDLEAHTQRTLDLAWADLDTGEARPVVERERYITNAQYVPVMSTCMQAPYSDDSDIAWFICQSRFPVTPTEYRILSDAQVDYLYGYLRRWTIPCLKLHGYAVGLIDHATFEQYGGLWNPLYSSDVAASISDEQYETLDEECGVDVVNEFPR